MLKWFRSYFKRDINNTRLEDYSYNKKLKKALIETFKKGSLITASLGYCGNKNVHGLLEKVVITDSDYERFGDYYYGEIHLHWFYFEKGTQRKVITIISEDEVNPSTNVFLEYNGTIFHKTICKNFIKSESNSKKDVWLITEADIAPELIIALTVRK